MSNFFDRKPLKPRKPESYRNAEVVSRDSSGLPPGELGLNAAHQPALSLKRPVYEKGYLLFRPWPALDYQRPTTHLQPARLSLEPGGQSNWLIGVTMAHYVGLPECGKISFNLVQPGTDQRIAENPYTIFYQACQRAQRYATRIPRVPAGQLDALTKGTQGSGAPLGKPNRYWHLLGHLYVRGSDQYVGSGRSQPLGLAPEDDLQVIRISDSAGLGLLDLLDRRKPGMEDYYDPSDLDKPFKYPPATGVFDPRTKTLVGGLFITIFNPKGWTFSRQELANSSYAPERSLRDNSKQTYQSYEAMVSRVWRDGDGVEHHPDMNAEQVAQIFAKSSFWLPDPEDPTQPSILRFAPYAEQVEWITRAFRPCGALLEYAYADHPEWQAIVRENCREVAFSIPDTPVVPQGFAPPPTEAEEDPTEDPWSRPSTSSPQPPLDPALAHLRAGQTPDVLRPDAPPAGVSLPPPPSRRRPVAPPPDLLDDDDEDESDLNDY
jgi:hypothetical protein